MKVFTCAVCERLRGELLCLKCLCDAARGNPAHAADVAFLDKFNHDWDELFGTNESPHNPDPPRAP